MGAGSYSLRRRPRLRWAAIAASGQGGLLVRCNAEESNALVSKTRAYPMVMQWREMQGWLRVDADAVRTKRQLAKWVEIGTSQARSLPAKH